MAVFAAGNPFSLSIADEPICSGEIGQIKPQDIDRVKDWIRVNKQILMDIYHQHKHADDVIFQIPESVRKLCFITSSFLLLNLPLS